MSAQTPDPREAIAARARRAVLGELGQPALRGSYALLAATALTAGLGLAFWVAAARLLPIEVLGAGSATVAAIITVANLGQLNLYQTAGVLLAGDRTPQRSMILRILATSTVSTVVIAVTAAVVAVAVGWSSQLTVSPVAFVLCAVAWTWFAVKDAILVGVRQFAAVPVANTMYGILKLAAIPLLAAAVPWESVVVATFLPAALVVPLVAVHLARKVPRSEPGWERASIDARFIGVDYVGFVCLQLSTTLLPFLVLLGAGAREAGVFAAVWMIVAMLDVLAHNAGVPLASETARDPDRADAIERAVRRRALVLVAIVVVAATLAAQPVLSLFGAQYAQSGTLTLQLMLLASVPRAYVVLSFARLRAQRQVTAIAVCESIHAIVLVGGCLLLLPLFGLPAVGWTWLLAQIGLAAACALLRMKPRGRAR